MKRLSAIEELQRTITVEVATIFNVFFETFSNQSLSSDEKRPKMADIVDKIPNRDQSAVNRILDNLNEKIGNAFSDQLFSQTKNGSYVMFPLAESLYQFSSEMVKGFQLITDTTSTEGKPILRVAINTFSFHTLIRVENLMREHSEGKDFERVFVGLRSHEIFDSIKHNPSIDTGIAESLIPLTSGRQLEVKKIEEHRLVLVSRTPLSENKINKDTGEIHLLALRDLPILLGDSPNFIDFLIALEEPDQEKFERRVNGMSSAAKKAWIKQRYNIRDMSSSVNFLLDVFMLGTENNCMLITPEVRKHIAAMNNKDYLEKGKFNLVYYNLPDNNYRLSKYALRRVNESQNGISQLFWRACSELSEELGSS